MTGFTVRAGRLLRDGEDFVPVGVNYHPSVAGCRIWTDWDPHALRSDFVRMAADGFDTVRLFVFWRDFEPEPGVYRDESFERLRDAVRFAGEAGLVCVLSLLTIWMNGQRLDLPWRRGRDLWLDKGMLERQVEFAKRVAGSLRGLGNVLAVDLGDEVSNVEPAAAAALSRTDVAGWHLLLASTLRRELPGVLVTQANDATGVFGGSPFGVDNAGGLDLIAVHGFPTWAPGSIESTMSYKATSLVPFLARFAGAYGLPYVDELGGYGVSDEVAARYLGAAAAAALANGAAGLAVWCWQDLTSATEPYDQRPGERHTGLRRIDGSPKPALARLSRVAASATELAGFSRGGTASIALYLPEAVRAGRGSYLDPDSGTVASFYAYLLLKRAHLDFDVVSGPIDGYRLVVCPSVTRVGAVDIERLGACLADGGSVYYSLGDHLHGFPGDAVAGVRLQDFRRCADGRESLRWGTGEWALDWEKETASDVVPTTADPVGFYGDGSPAVFVNAVGPGRMLFCGAPVERQLDRPGRLDAWGGERFYRRIAEFAGVLPDVDCTLPEVEVVPARADPGGAALVVNHGAEPARVVLSWRTGATAEVELEPKDWRIVPAGTGVSG
ncbi:beta-galactosidase trimerization domain-containing protein [Amycolatopsis sp. lyj-108]|uniref:beta-galactosidase trimerization domain-containing protein n=1 Tax=Amycolatopsis sp. lyj-108 TaxID=2789286 RepID=UPI00397A6FD2